MNQPERTELARLKEQQARLERELKLLSVEIASLGRRLDHQPEASVQGTHGPATLSPEVSRPPEPPLPAPPVLSASNTASAAPVAETAAATASFSSGPQVQARIAVPPPVAPPSAPAIPAPKPASLEMQVGTFWLVRIGIVLVLGGLAFFAKLAYQQYISRLGPAGKVVLLYLVSGVLLGAGWWWQRREVKESLKNYGRVLFAGGLAALYFTTYGAHYLEPLQVISSRLLDGFLLLGCAGLMVWCADRAKSEALAMSAVGLSYFTSIITRVGYFTLYSNLVLTLAGVVFLVRNRWAMLSFGSVAATYAAYGFWRFFDGAEWHWASPSQGLWVGTYFLVCYWLLFTAAVFLSRDRKFAGQNRASYLTLNNSVFFGMFLLTMLQVREGGFWKFALCYGGVLLGCAAAARRVLSEEPLAKNAYLTQGLLLVTVGLIVKFSGLQLALILGMESVVLLVAGQQRSNLVLLVSAGVAAGLAVAWGIDGLREMEPSGIWLAAGLGAMMLANTVLAHRRNPALPAKHIRAQPSYFTVLALVIWLAATYDNSTREHLPLCLAGEAVLLTLSIYLLGIPEVILFGQSFLLLAQAGWFFELLALSYSPPWWNSALLLAITVGMSQWWQKQTFATLSAEFARVYRWVAVGMALLWVWEYIPARERIWVFSLLGLLVFLGAGLRRNREALLVAAVFTLAALVLFWLPLLTPSTVYWPNLCAMILLLGQRQLARRFPERYVIEPGIHAAIILAGGLSLWLFLSRWVGETDNARFLTACWSLLALGLFATGIVLRERTYRWLGLGILGCAVVRVGVVDVWKLEALYRVLSLMALGMALLVLGFVYSKYQEKIREWL